MSELILDVRLDGFAEPAGVLVRDDRGALAFAYTAAHLADADALPVSLSLPLTDEPYEDVISRAFFDNLLQERDGALADVMAREGLARDDIAGLLQHLGKDCAGALSVLPAGAPAVKVPGDYATDYVVFSEERLTSIIAALQERRALPEGTSDPSPLAGVQSKIALTLLPDGRMAEPNAGTGAPTTHILKVPDRAHLRDAAHEAATLGLSRQLGFETVEAEVFEKGGIAALLVKRFDRAHDGNGRVIRLHQEDFAQALGLPARLKYERHGADGRRFDAAAIKRVLDATADPAGERDRFIGATLFDLMTGNVDGHAKNFALLHEPGSRLRVAPRYDLLPTRLDAALTDELAFNIGAATTLSAITRADLDAFLQILGVAGAAARRRVAERHGRLIADGLGNALTNLGNTGMKTFADLIASNLRQLLPVLGLPIPEAARARDAFIGRGGGWLVS
ncbi:MAG: HipA domain-containing protein [Hyphomicrobiaceae bacterium]